VECAGQDRPQINANASYNRHDNATQLSVIESDTVVVNGVSTPLNSRNVDITTHARGGAAEASFTYLQPIIDFTVFPATVWGLCRK